MRDPHEFDDFYRHTRQRVLAYLYAVGGDLAEAQDAAQEAYTRAWQGWDRISGYTDPETWVRVVGWRVLANRWRKLRGQRRAYRRHGAADAVPPPGEDTVLLVAALRRLPVEQRRAIVLHHIAGIPVERVAEEVGAPVGTVKARLHRGRRTLAGLIGTPVREDNHA